MTDHIPSIAVVVSTYQRRPLLARLVQALERQTLPASSFEVVIADNGSTDGSHTELLDLASRTSIDMRVLRIEKNRGPSAGRNAAWRASRADIVAFTDDDCIPTTGWLAAALSAMDDGAGIVAGRTEPDPVQLPELGPFSRTVWPGYARFFPTCNVTYRRADLEAVGGFDESFVGVGAEDTDLGWRIKQLGAETAFVDEALVYHDVGENDFRRALRETTRWIDLPRLFAKLPETRREYLVNGMFWKRTHPRVILAALGLLLTPLLPFAVVAVSPWLWMRTRRSAVPRRETIRMLPGIFVVDLFEVFVMLRGSVRHRTLVL